MISALLMQCKIHSDPGSINISNTESKAKPRLSMDQGDRKSGIRGSICKSAAYKFHRSKFAHFGSLVRRLVSPSSRYWRDGGGSSASQTEGRKTGVRRQKNDTFAGTFSVLEFASA